MSPTSPQNLLSSKWLELSVLHVGNSNASRVQAQPDIVINGLLNEGLFLALRLITSVSGQPQTFMGLQIGHLSNSLVTSEWTFSLKSSPLLDERLFQLTEKVISWTRRWTEPLKLVFKLNSIEQFLFIVLAKCSTKRLKHILRSTLILGRYNFTFYSGRRSGSDYFTFDLQKPSTSFVVLNLRPWVFKSSK